MKVYQLSAAIHLSFNSIWRFIRFFYTLAFTNGRHVRNPQKAVLAHGTASIMQKWNGSKQRDFSRINFGQRACWLPWVGHYHAWNCREEKTEPKGRWEICWTWKLHDAERKLRLTTMEEARWASTKAFFLLLHRSFSLIGLFWVSWSPSSSSSSVALRLESQMFITFSSPNPNPLHQRVCNLILSRRFSSEGHLWPW